MRWSSALPMSGVTFRMDIGNTGEERPVLAHADCHQSGLRETYVSPPL